MVKWERVAVRERSRDGALRRLLERLTIDISMERLLIRLAIYIVAPVVASLFTYLVMAKMFLEPLHPDDTTRIFVEIEPQRTLGEIATLIADKGVIRSRWSLQLLAQFRKVTSGIHVGEYELSPSMAPGEVLEKLLKGDTYKRKLVVHEGGSVWDVARDVDEAKLLSESEFAKALVNSGLLAAAGISAPSFEGYLWPSTYEFSRPVSANQIIRTMVDEAERHWPAEYTTRADELQLNRHEVLTLASIVQKESKKPEDQPLVASVIHNRLSKGMKLQSDATVIYGLTNFNGTLTKADRDALSPYNTYTNYGLPPGPVGNPGEGAIRAALFFPETSYLFFVSDGEGGLSFLTTQEEYNEALARLPQAAQK